MSPIALGLLLIVQAVLLFLFVSLIPKKSIRKIGFILSSVVQVVIVGVIVAVVVIELDKPHYMFDVTDMVTYHAYRSSDDDVVSISIDNGETEIIPRGFRVSGQDYIDYQTIDYYLNQLDEEEIPMMDDAFMVSMHIDDQMVSHRVHVYFESGYLKRSVDDWIELDQLDVGTYYVLIDISLYGDPMEPYADYLFVLNVVE